MFSVRLINERTGKPIKNEKIFVTYGFPVGSWKEEWTNGEGDAYFDINDSNTVVKHKGKVLHKGKVSGCIVAYV